MRFLNNKNDIENLANAVKNCQDIAVETVDTKKLLI